jgi:hypothetical protein
MVLAAGSDLQWSQREVLFSGGTHIGSKQPNSILIEFGDGEFVACTGDHLFLLASGKLRMASRLAPGDELTRPDGTAVTVGAVHRGDFYSGFHHIATSRDDPKGVLDGHLLITAGVVSADFTVQLFKEEFLDEREATLPEVGSAAYDARHGTPREPFAFETFAGGKIVSGRPGLASVVLDALRSTQDVHSPIGSVSGGERRIGSRPVFITGSATRVEVPPDAASFISDAEAAEKANDAMRSLDDATSLDEANGVVFHTSAYSPYNNVVYHVDWYDNTVNAFAWITNGVRHVALKGGLLRHTAIHFQATALVLAHELGHHFGGQPTFPGGLSCEGRADFYGANIVMRKVWFGDFYLGVMGPAIQQLQNFFAPNPGNHGCNHPARDCRISIYRAAVELKRIPACAFAP